MLSRLQTVFELELRRNGIIVTVNAPNYLSAFVTVLDADGIVAYSYDIEFWESALTIRRYWDLIFASRDAGIAEVGNSVDPTGLTLRQAAAAWQHLVSTTNGSEVFTTWSPAGGLATVGRRNLQDALETTVQDLAQAFVNAHLAANPRPR